MHRLPSKENNKATSPASFLPFPNCRVVVDCTDVEIAVPREMDLQRVTYSFYRGMISFKVLSGVSPNAVITYVSTLYPGPTSDRAIVQNSGILHNCMAGDLILAYKGFLIADILPPGVTLNIPPFLEHAQFTKTKSLHQRNCHLQNSC